MQPFSGLWHVERIFIAIAVKFICIGNTQGCTLSEARPNTFIEVYIFVIILSFVNFFEFEWENEALGVNCPVTAALPVYWAESPA